MNLFEVKWHSNIHIIKRSGEVNLDVIKFSKNLEDFIKKVKSGQINEDFFGDVKCTSEDNYDSHKIYSDEDHSKLVSGGRGTVISSSGDYSLIGNNVNYSKISNSGDRSNIINLGRDCEITNSGESSELLNYGNYSKISNSGLRTLIYNKADGCTISNSADENIIYNKAFNCRITESGFDSYIENDGVHCEITTNGSHSKIINNGLGTKISSCGEFTEIESNGKYCFISNIGISGKVKGVKGTWITLAEYNISSGYNEFLTIKTAQIDGKILKENTLYELIEGEFKEVESVNAYLKFRNIDD